MREIDQQDSFLPPAIIGEQQELPEAVWDPHNDHFQLPLWNGDRWQQSTGYKELVHYQATQTTSDNQFGTIVVPLGGELEQFLKGCFSYYQHLRKTDYGVAYISYPIITPEDEGSRIDLFFTESGWDCRAETLRQLQVPFDETAPVSERPTTYPVWRTDFLITKPPLYQIFERGPDIYIKQKGVFQRFGDTT